MQLGTNLFRRVIGLPLIAAGVLLLAGPIIAITYIGGFWYTISLLIFGGLPAFLGFGVIGLLLLIIGIKFLTKKQ
jgi:hypothetical protein